MNVGQRLLRNRLRARGRALGRSARSASGHQIIDHLAADAAYEHWHRLLFTRFLTENHLLITDAAYGSVPVTLQDCEELAPELGARDGFELACRFAGQILPGVFRQDDPVLELTLALERSGGAAPAARRAAGGDLPRRRRARLDLSVLADPAEGGGQRFRQEDRGRRTRGGHPALHRGLHGGVPAPQHAGRVVGGQGLARSSAATEAEARGQGMPCAARDGLPGIVWTYLRFVRDETTQNWPPAAGTFDGWPKAAKEIQLPRSLHGQRAFPGVRPAAAGPVAHGGGKPVRRRSGRRRAARQPARAGARPALHPDRRVQCRPDRLEARRLSAAAAAASGLLWLAPQAKKADWLKLAGDNDKLRRGMERLYDLFEKAPVLGSLIDPSHSGDLLEAGFTELHPLLERALQAERRDDTAYELAVTAQGIAKAAEILAGKFTLVATNVPYLGRGKQDEVIKNYCGRIYPQSKADSCYLFY